MSDIGFDGVAAAFVSILMLAVAAIGLIIEVVLRFRRGSWPKAAFIAPGLYGSAALTFLAVAEYGALEVKELVDIAAPLTALVGLGAWLVIRLR